MATLAQETFELVKKWDLDGSSSITGEPFNLIYDRIEFLAGTLYHQYVPTLASEHPEFPARLGAWLSGVSDESDKRTLLELVPCILFLGREEFAKLHQAAFCGPITRWMVEQLGLSLDDPEIDAKLAGELHQHTWYCPVTDSMQISDFHHTNQIGGVDYRPDFRSLAEFGDPAKVSYFMENHKGGTQPLHRIVLLEDFVGAGTQLESAVAFAASLSPSISVLLLPLIICPEGAENARLLAARYPNVKYEAVLELPVDVFINRKTLLAPGPLEDAVRDLAERCYSEVTGDDVAAPRPYSPFGFCETGALVVMYSNTPANTLPMIHHVSNTWRALFPRSARVR